MTENGAFKVPLDDSFYDTEGIINDMLFDPDDPARRFVVAYTGAYFTVDGLRWGRMMSTTALPQHTQMAMLDTVSDACNHALYIATGGRGMLRLKPLPVAMRDTNVTSITGRRIVGPLTSWQTPNGPFTVEHLAGRDANGHLIVFWWSPPHDWQAIDVTAITGRTIDRAADELADAEWSVSRRASRRARCERTSDRVLVVAATRLAGGGRHRDHRPRDHRPASRAGRRRMVRRTSSTSQRATARVACACSTGRPRTTGASSTSPTISGVPVIGTPTSWQTHDGTLLTEHLAAQSPSGELIEYLMVARARLAGGQRHRGSPVSHRRRADELADTERPADGDAPRGHEPDRRLMVFFTSPGHNWQAVDVTARTGAFVSGDVASWQVNKCRPVNFEHLAATDASGHFRFHLVAGERLVCDRRDRVHRVSVQAGATAWQTPNGPFNVEHLAAPTASGDLVVFFTRASEVLTGRAG